MLRVARFASSAIFRLGCSIADSKGCSCWRGLAIIILPEDFAEFQAADSSAARNCIYNSGVPVQEDSSIFLMRLREDTQVFTTKWNPASFRLSFPVQRVGG